MFLLDVLSRPARLELKEEQQAMANGSFSTSLLFCCHSMLTVCAVSGLEHF
jgi:hypothetical protein